MKVSGNDTNGAIAIFEQTELSPRRGVPMHIHPDQDGIFQLLERKYHFQVDKEKFQLTAGETIFCQERLLTHGFRSVNEPE